MKNTDTAAHKGYDVGKKVSGIKRHIAVDTVAGATVQVTNRKGALQALNRCKPVLERVESLLCDSGDVGQPFAQGVREILGEHVTAPIAKRSELHTFKVMPKRWVVERSFAWLEKNRRLWKNCERLLDTSLQFIHLAFLALLLATLLVGCASHIMEIDDIQPLRVQEISASSPEMIKLSGLLFHSALGISRVETVQTGETLHVRVYAALVSDANPSGNLDYALEVPASVDRIVLGNKQSLIWTRHKVSSEPAPKPENPI